MSKKIDLVIDMDMFRKSKLTTVQYVTLAYLRQDTDIVFSREETEVFRQLEELGYIRIIEAHIIVDAKTETIFETNYSAGAKEILAHYNAMKKEHLGISRPTKAVKYITKFKSLIVADYDVQYVKDVLSYVFRTWKKDDFMKKFLLSIDTIVGKFDKYSGEYEMNKNKVVIKQSKMA